MTIDQGLAAVLGALLGAIITVTIARWNSEQKKDELFFMALEFLGGGTQKRNLGISAMELFWKGERHQNLVISLLTGSAIYLLEESDSRDEVHELYNLRRIMSLLTSIKKPTDSQKPSYVSSLSAIKKAQGPNRTKGVIVPKQDLDSWEVKVKLITGL